MIDGETTKTSGGAGGFTIDLTDGEHTIVVSKEGYVTKTETITVSESDDDFQIVLTVE